MSIMKAWRRHRRVAGLTAAFLLFRNIVEADLVCSYMDQCSNNAPVSGKRNPIYDC